MSISQDELKGLFFDACTYGDLTKTKATIAVITDFQGMKAVQKLATDAITGTIGEYGELNIVKYLVEELHADIADNAIFFAAYGGHFEIVKYLVEDCKVNIHADKESALRWSGNMEHLDIVKYLTEQGADCEVFKDEPDWKGEYEFCRAIAKTVIAVQKKEAQAINLKKAEQRFKDNVTLLKQAVPGTEKYPLRRRPVFKK